MVTTSHFTIPNICIKQNLIEKPQENTIQESDKAKFSI